MNPKGSAEVETSQSLLQVSKPGKTGNKVHTEEDPTPSNSKQHARNVYGAKIMPDSNQVHRHVPASFMDQGRRHVPAAATLYPGRPAGDVVAHGHRAERAVKHVGSRTNAEDSERLDMSPTNALSFIQTAETVAVAAPFIQTGTN